MRWLVSELASALSEYWRMLTMPAYVTLTDLESGKRLYILASEVIIIRPETSISGEQFTVIEPARPNGDALLVAETCTEVLAAVYAALREPQEQV